LRTSITEWGNCFAGCSDNGFSGIPTTPNVGVVTRWLSSTEVYSDNIWHYDLQTDNIHKRNGAKQESYNFDVRCVRDLSEP
jgi:hypothetical protein